MEIVLDDMEFKSILAALFCRRILRIERLSKNTFHLEECCDNNFDIILSEDQLLAFAGEIINFVHSGVVHGEDYGDRDAVLLQLQQEDETAV